jgi:hypothetical protein
MSGWLTRGELLDAESCEAAEHFGKCLAAFSAADVAVWLDSKVLPRCHSACRPETVWLKDGPFHWYAFQWSAGIYNNVDLFLRI